MIMCCPARLGDAHSLTDASHVERVRRERDNVAEAVIAGDPDTARAAMRLHLGNTRRRLDADRLEWAIARGRVSCCRRSNLAPGTASRRRRRARRVPFPSTAGALHRADRSRARYPARPVRNLHFTPSIFMGSLVRRSMPSCQIQCVQGGVLAGRRGADVSEHRQGDIEVVIGVRAPCQVELLADLRDPDRALHGPEVRVGKGNVDAVQREVVGWRQSVATMLVAVGRPVALRNSAMISRPENPLRHRTGLPRR